MKHIYRRGTYFLIPVLACLCVLTFPACKTAVKKPADAPKKTVQQNGHPHLCRYTQPMNEIIINGWGQFAAGQYEAAAMDFERLIAKGYHDSDIYFGAGISHSRAYNERTALKYLMRAIEADPNNFEARFARMQLYITLHKPAEAQLDADYIQTITCTKPLVCGMYFYENDIADCEKLEKRKKEAALVKMSHD